MNEWKKKWVGFAEDMSQQTHCIFWRLSKHQMLRTRFTQAAFEVCQENNLEARQNGRTFQNASMLVNQAEHYTVVHVSGG